MSAECTHCGAVTTNGYLCAGDTGRLVAVYAQLPNALGDLMNTAYRQDKVSAPGGGKVGKGHARPLPYKLAAADLLHDTTAELLKLYAGPDLGSYHRLCTALLDLLPHHLRSNPDLGRHLGVLSANLDRIRVLTDLPQMLRYLGPCDFCNATLTADADAVVALCDGPDCSASYDVGARTAELVERARDFTADMSTLSQALSTLVTPLSEQDIWNWRHRGKLTPVRTEGRTAFYRVGDVVDLLVARLRRAQHLAERRPPTRR